GHGGTATATVNITVTAVNDAPVAANDAFATDEDTPLNGNVLTNDSDVDGNTLTASVVANPAHGTVTMGANGAFTYTPAANYNGADSFTYRASDGSLTSALATVNITVIAVNDAPVVDAGPDLTVNLPAAATLAGTAVDVDSGSLTIAWSMVSGPGTVTFANPNA